MHDSFWILALVLDEEAVARVRWSVPTVAHPSRVAVVMGTGW